MAFTYTCKYCGHTIHQEGSWNGYCAWCGRYLEDEMFDASKSGAILKLLLVGASIFIIILYLLILFIFNSFSLTNLGIGVVVCVIVDFIIWLSI